MASFDEKVSICLEDINEFMDSVKKVHVSKCNLDQCDIGMFSDELYSYVHLKRQSPRLIKVFFLHLCEKYPQGFNDCFLAAKNKDFMITFFTAR